MFALQVFADGSLGSRGACLLKPYSDQKTNWDAIAKAKIYEEKLAKIKELGYQACPCNWRLNQQNSSKILC